MSWDDLLHQASIDVKSNKYDKEWFCLVKGGVVLFSYHWELISRDCGNQKRKNYIRRDPCTVKS